MRKKRKRNISNNLFTKTSASTAGVRRLIPELLITALSLGLLTIFIGIVTGIHYDETWVILRCQEIANGLRPLDGGTPYSGAIHQYILWPFFSLFGYRIEVLRTVSAIFNTGGMILVMVLFRQYYPHATIHRFAGLMLCTTPAFIIFSRYAAEVQCLNPFLTIASLLLLTLATKAPDTRHLTIRALAAGTCLGVISYNHIVGIAVPLALLAASLIVHGRAVLTSRVMRISAMGFVLGFSVRLYEILFNNFIAAGMRKASESSFSDFLIDLPNLPVIFHSLINGSLLYQRFVGDNRLPVFPYMTLIIIFFISARLFLLKDRQFKTAERLMLYFWGFLVFFTIAISPNFTPHYFILPIYMLSIILVILALPFQETSCIRLKNTARGILMAVVAFNLFYVGINYFGEFLKTGGKLSVFMVGKRLIETSNSWIRFDTLYGDLSRHRVATVVTDLSIYSALQIHDMYNHRLSILSYHWIPSNPQELVNKTALIFFNGINLVTKRQIKPPNQSTLIIGSVQYTHDPSFDPHFKVFIAEPGQR